MKVWNMMVPDELIMPMDRAVFIQLDWDKIDAHMHIPEVALLARYNEQISMDTVNMLERNAMLAGRKFNMPKNPGRKYDPFICLPEHYKTLPSWVSCIVNTEEVADKLLSPFKQILGLFDVYLAQTKGGMVSSRMLMI
jgi:hypothetical protein